MATFSKTILSASTDGRAIKVVATASTGTTIHTGSATAADLHEVWLYAQNTDTAARKLTIQWGSTSSPDDDIELTVQAESGLILITPGLLIKGNATPLVVRAFAATANVIMIHGFVNVIA
jgi:hypothetical protein